MAYQVIDAAGRIIELQDDEVVPPGCKLRVSTVFMDSTQKQVMRDSDPYPITDEQVQRCVDAREAFKARLSRGMHRHQVTEPGAAADGDDPRAVAYGAMKRRLGTPKARR